MDAGFAVFAVYADMALAIFAGDEADGVEGSEIRDEVVGVAQVLVSASLVPAVGAAKIEVGHGIARDHAGRKGIAAEYFGVVKWAQAGCFEQGYWIAVGVCGGEAMVADDEEEGVIELVAAAQLVGELADAVVEVVIGGQGAVREGVFEMAVLVHAREDAEDKVWIVAQGAQ